MDIHYTFKKYEEAYPLLLKDFLSEYEDNSELDFLKIQLDRYSFFLQNANLIEYSVGHDPLPEVEFSGYSANKEIESKILTRDEAGNRIYDYDLADKLYRSFKKIIQFIESKISSIENENTFSENEEQIEIDLSDSNGAEKIIMLYKLGVLDFLKSQAPFNASTNSLASAISGITGLKLTTVQSYINPIYSEKVDQKNNPLESKKALEKVENKLLKVGFKPLK